MFYGPGHEFILVNVPCELEKTVYSAVVGHSSLHMSIISGWLMVLFNLTVSLTTFCLLGMSITDRYIEGSNYNSRVVYLSLWFYRFLPDIFDALLLGTYTFKIFISSWRLISSSFWNAYLNLSYYSLLWNLL